MKILVLTDHYPPFHTGGYDVACEATTEGLRALGHDILVLTSRFGVGRGERNGHVLRTLHRPQDSASMLTWARWERHDHRTLQRVLRTWRPDLVSAWKLYQLFPSLLHPLAMAGLPVVFNLHDLWLPALCAESERMCRQWAQPGSTLVKSAIKSPVRGLTQLGLRNALDRPVAVDDVPRQHAIYCSAFRQRQHHEAGLPFVHEDVIYNGIDCKRFSGESLPDGAVRALFVGRLVEEKGVHTAIEALGILAARNTQDVRLTILGIPSYPSHYEQRLRHHVATLGLSRSVRFVASVSGEEMPDVYRQHNVLVFPSIGPEGFPMAVLEAAACGLAIVGTQTGGTGEFLVDGETGLVFAPNQAAALADHLHRLGRDPGLRQRLALCAQRRVRNAFEISGAVRRTADFLNATHVAGTRGTLQPQTAGETQ